MYAKKVFTDKELRVFTMKLKGASGKDIAKAMKVSESDISQTLGRIRRKISTVKDSIELLTTIGAIKEGPRYVLTEEGREFTESQVERAPPRITRAPMKHRSVRMLETEPVALSVYPEEVVIRWYGKHAWQIVTCESASFKRVG